ncbi:MAG: DUF2935 domain-containing protein [Lachnospiraceae bacterium]|nr:DUF2935 domain-containing protein [Lachnospiraceae bacterium]
MKEYVILSLETHLFFGRIMKEHSLFLLAGFPAKKTTFIRRSDQFREEFEDELRKTVRLADGIVSESVLNSGEIVTEFTGKAECQTRNLTGIPIDIKITEAEERLRAGGCVTVNREIISHVRMLNRQMQRSLNGLISLKEEILREVAECRLYTTNYPLLIEHILREARLYRQIISELERRGRISSPDLRNMEIFWNQIMMEHAQFIQGLLDPTECELMEAADGFAKDYCRLIEEAKEQDRREMNALTARTLRVTEQYQEFKTAGTEGITGCEIRSVILPLLADHVLREANHYLRILADAQKDRDLCGIMGPKAVTG